MLCVLTYIFYNVCFVGHFFPFSVLYGAVFNVYNFMHFCFVRVQETVYVRVCSCSSPCLNELVPSQSESEKKDRKKTKYTGQGGSKYGGWWGGRLRDKKSGDGGAEVSRPPSAAGSR